MSDTRLADPDPSTPELKGKSASRSRPPGVPEIPRDRLESPGARVAAVVAIAAVAAGTILPVAFRSSAPARPHSMSQPHKKLPAAAKPSLTPGERWIELNGGRRTIINELRKDGVDVALSARILANVAHDPSRALVEVRDLLSLRNGTKTPSLLALETAAGYLAIWQARQGSGRGREGGELGGAYQAQWTDTFRQHGGPNRVLDERLPGETVHGLTAHEVDRVLVALYGTRLPKLGRSAVRVGATPTPAKSRAHGHGVLNTGTDRVGSSTTIGDIAASGKPVYGYVDVSQDQMGIDADGHVIIFNWTDVEPYSGANAGDTYAKVTYRGGRWTINISSEGLGELIPDPAWAPDTVTTMSGISINGAKTQPTVQVPDAGQGLSAGAEPVGVSMG